MPYCNRTNTTKTLYCVDHFTCVQHFARVFNLVYLSLLITLKCNPDQFAFYSGAVRDATGSFGVVMVICCVSNLLGGSCLFLYPLVARLEEQRQKRLGLLNKVEKV